MIKTFDLGPRSTPFISRSLLSLSVGWKYVRYFRQRYYNFDTPICKKSAESKEDQNKDTDLHILKEKGVNVGGNIDRMHVNGIVQYKFSLFWPVEYPDITLYL